MCSSHGDQDSKRALHYQRLQDKHATCFLHPLSLFKTAQCKLLIVTGKLFRYQLLSITFRKKKKQVKTAYGG